jgi:hypothetical protein
MLVPEYYIAELLNKSKHNIKHEKYFKAVFKMK